MSQFVSIYLNLSQPVLICLWNLSQSISIGKSGKFLIALIWHDRAVDYFDRTSEYGKRQTWVVNTYKFMPWLQSVWTLAIDPSDGYVTVKSDNP